MIYLFLVIVALLAYIAWKETAAQRERRDFYVAVKARTAGEFAEAKKELDRKPEPEEEKEPDEVALDDVDPEKFQEMIKKQNEEHAE